MSEIDLIHDLAQSDLYSVPKDILYMINLKMLYLEGNYLEELPCELFLLLEKLNWLDVRNNKLKIIPKSIMNHPSLETFLLQNNEVESLPMEMGFLPNLRVLQLAGNPIIYPKEKIIDGGLNSITVFLKNEYLTANARLENETSGSETYSDNFENLNRKNNTKSAESISSHKGISMPVMNFRSLYRIRDHSFRKKNSKKAVKSRSKHTIYKDTPHSNSNRYLNMHPLKKNEIRVKEQQMKDLWLKKLKEIMNRQDELLQRERDLEALRNWRYNTKYKNKKYDASYRPEVPYDYDSEYDRIPSRSDLEKQMDKMNKPLHRTRSKKMNVEKLITDIVESLKAMEQERTTEKSPQAQMDYAGREIKRILELQRRLSALKLTNDRIL